MTLEELTTELLRIINDRNKDWVVVIDLEEPSIGPQACERVERVFQGFDWDKGKVFLRPEKPLVHKK